MGLLAGLAGLVASAPVMVAGATAKGAGQALSAGAGDLKMLRVTGEILESAGEYGMSAASSINEGISNVELSGVDFAALGRGMSGMGFTSLTPGSRENSVALARAPEIEAPSVAPAVVQTQTILPKGIEHVDILDVGQMPSPTFSVTPANITAPTVGGRGQ